MSDLITADLCSGKYMTPEEASAPPGKNIVLFSGEFGPVDGEVVQAGAHVEPAVATCMPLLRTSVGRRGHASTLLISAGEGG